MATSKKQDRACRDCLKKIRKYNHVTETGRSSTGGDCRYCMRWRPEIIWFTADRKE